MKRKIKAIVLSVVLALLVSSAMEVPVKAMNVPRSTIKTIIIAGQAVQIDAKLTKKEIALITPELIAELDLSDGPIISVTKKITDFNQSVESPPQFIAPLAVIPTSQLSLTVTAQRYKQSTVYDYIKFTAVATWAYLPAIKLTDHFGICWSDDFTLSSSSCRVTYYDDNNVEYLLYPPLSSCAPEAGLGYDFAMLVRPDPYDYFDERLLKKATISAYTYKYNSTDSANVVAEYAHEYINILGFGVDMSFDRSGPSIGFSADFGICINTASPAFVSFNY